MGGALEALWQHAFQSVLTMIQPYSRFVFINAVTDVEEAALALVEMMAAMLLPAWRIAQVKLSLIASLVARRSFLLSSDFSLTLCGSGRTCHFRSHWPFDGRLGEGGLSSYYSYDGCPG